MSIILRLEITRRPETLFPGCRKMESEIMKTLVRTGAIGAVLVWALIQNQTLVGRVIDTNAQTVKVLTELTSEIRQLRGP